jgi:Zn2+/Cd2+-exporting ATPase
MKNQTRYYIAAMDCPTEEQIIRNGLKGHASVEQLDFDLINRVLTVTHPAEYDQDSLQRALAKLGMAPQIAGNHESVQKAQEETTRNHRLKWIWLGLSGLLAGSAEIVAWQTGDEKSILVIGMVLVSLLLSGRDTFRKAITSIQTFTLNINFLMALAVIGAMVIGQWPEAAMVTFLFGVSEMIESYALEKARNAIATLVQIVPETASVWDTHPGEAEGHWHELPVAEVGTGQRVRVKPGERIALDGKVLEGASAVNQAPITGESLPIEKQIDDPVFAGTINGRGLLVIEVTAAKGNTTLDKIARAVQEAQSEKAPTQRFVDRFARIYTPTVVIVALLVAVLPPLIANESWQAWLYKALVMLVIACPCALVISTPVTVVSGLAAAARQGILIKGGAYLEGGKYLKAVALDKTGTLTTGRPVVTDVVPLGDGSPEYLLHLAASLDAGSEHPVASAIVALCAKGHDCKPLPVMEFEALVGRGVTGKIDGKRYYVGNHRLTEENKVCSPEVEAVLAQFESAGKTPVILTDDSKALAVLGVADTLRETSVQAIQELHALGIRTLMLTGDNQNTAEAIAKLAGVDDPKGDLLPEDKLTIINSLLEKYGKEGVGMIGDGINDAPALAKASIGFAMGAAGTDTAIETADVALMEDDLRKLPAFVRLSRKTGQVLIQNISLALGIKIVFFILAIFGKTTLWMAVFADLGASLLVIINGLRMLSVPPKK